jgi:hypothetical protein
MHIMDLPTSDPMITKKYNSNIKTDMKASNIQLKIKKLRRLTSNATSTTILSNKEMMDLYEELAAFQQVAGVRALKRLRHKHAEACRSSPTFPQNDQALRPQMSLV